MLIFKADQPVAGNTLLAAVHERCGARVEDCYQCGKCTAGCPVSSFMDLMPRQVMRGVQLGQHDLVLNSHAIWLCASCQVCSARCPMEIDVAGVMEALRHLALAEGVRPAEREVMLVHNLFLESVKRLGRVYEVGLAAGLNVGNLRPFANVADLAVPMFRRGKLNVVPERGGGKDVQKIFVKVKQGRG